MDMNVLVNVREVLVAFLMINHHPLYYHPLRQR